MTLKTLSENEIIVTLVALALLLFMAFCFGTLMEKIKAPRVVGEIAGGILLGATCLYHFFPEVMGGIFLAYEQEGKVLNVFYQLGLIFLMFLSGYNTKLEVDRKNGKTIFFVFFGAIYFALVGIQLNLIHDFSIVRFALFIEFFTVLILTTMLSSVIAGYWLRHQQKVDDGIFMNLTKE